MPSSERPVPLSAQAHCFHHSCADLSVLWPSQKVFLESQLQLGPLMQKEAEIVGVFMHHQKCAWTSEGQKAACVLQAACALK